MKTFRTLLLGIFVLISVQFSQVRSEELSIIIHDQQIKHFFALKGLDFDKAFRNAVSGSNNEKSCLVEQVKEIFNKRIEKLGSLNFASMKKTFESPQSQDRLSDIITQVFGIYPLDRCIQDQNQEIVNQYNQANENYFESLLESGNVYMQEYDYENYYYVYLNFGYVMSYNNVFCGIRDAVCLYLESSFDASNERLHLYLKMSFDTEKKIVRILAAPNLNQEGFATAYDPNVITDIAEKAKMYQEFEKSYRERGLTPRDYNAITGLVIFSAILGVKTLLNAYDII